MKHPLLPFSIIPLIFLLCLFFCNTQQGENLDTETKDLELNKIPQVVMESLKARFPKAEIQQWTQEEEGDLILYDIEFRQENQKFEADIKEDGSIHNWEKEVTDQDLPEVVKKVVETKYQEYIIKEIMEITAVNNGQDTLEGYEVVLETADNKEIEITIAPDGNILEDSGETN